MRLKLGIVTYNIAKDWDLDTIINKKTFQLAQSKGGGKSLSPKHLITKDLGESY